MASTFVLSTSKLGKQKVAFWSTSELEITISLGSKYGDSLTEDFCILEFETSNNVVNNYNDYSVNFVVILQV